MPRSACISFVLTGLLAASCGGDPATPVSGAKGASGTPAAFLAAHRGEVVVALLGMKGCPKTEAGTALLARMAPAFPAGVAVARIDVPPPEGIAPVVADWKHPYFYGVDEGRAVASGLDFFYYPTLFVLDREGAVRYSGGCEEEPLRRMVSEIAAEAPGGEKKVYTPPLPAVDSPAPGFTAKDLDGAPADHASFAGDRPTLLFFTSIGCPFGREAASGLLDLELGFEGREIDFVTIEKSPSSSVAKEFYDGVDMPGAVLVDPDGAVSRLYGVEPVPFFFVVDAGGEIAARGPYTPEAAKAALSAALGLAPAGAEGAKPAGAG
ncbi:MAG: redoxin domain-containing protein [Planctomycetes bacterium]|nr:redoxin domain-containing protein [Planctomycetota bacterium]